jgi:hypothetical protein
MPSSTKNQIIIPKYKSVRIRMDDNQISVYNRGFVFYFDLSSINQKNKALLIEGSYVYLAYNEVLEIIQPIIQQIEFVGYDDDGI